MIGTHEMLKCDVAIRPYIIDTSRADSCHHPCLDSSAGRCTSALSLPHMLTLADTKNGLDSSHDYPMHAAHDHHRHSPFFSDGGEQSVRQLPTSDHPLVRQTMLMSAIFLL